MYIVQRTQIYLDELSAGRLDERARARGATRSAVIRDAIDRYLELDDRAEAEVVARQRDALLGVFGIAPELAGAVTEFRAADTERAIDLDRRRQG